MKLSIVIPSYNQAQYLPDAIESCLAQGEVEIIVVDDGSTDNSLEVARRYDVKVISQVNKGLAAARNAGIMNANGEYILFLDSDDILLDDAVNVMIKIIEDTGADVVSGSFKCFGVQNAEVILMPNPTLEDFKTGNRIGYCSAVKRSVLQEVGGFSSRMWCGYEDYALWFDLLSRGKKFKTIQEVLWLYRTKERSMIHEAMEHHAELMAQIVKDFPKVFPQSVEIKSPLPK